MKRETDFILIEDNLIDFMIHKIILRNELKNPTITHFKNAGLALTYIAENYTVETTRKTVVLLDLEMPLMDGEEFLEHFEKLDRRITNQLKIMVVSATQNPRVIDRVHTNPYVYQFIAKPLEKEKITQLLSEIVYDQECQGIKVEKQ